MILGLLNGRALKRSKYDDFNIAWKQLGGNLEKIFWQKLRAEIGRLNSGEVKTQHNKEGFRPQNRQTEFQRLSRHYIASPPRAVVQTMSPKFSNKFDRGIQQRLWDNVMATAKKKTMGNILTSNDQNNGQLSRQNDQNDPWITMLADDNGSRVNKPYQYAYDLTWPKYAVAVQPQLDQVGLNGGHLNQMCKFFCKIFFDFDVNFHIMNYDFYHR